MISYCCCEIYKEVLKARFQYENLSHKPLNLVFREKIPSFLDTFFAYEKKFNGYIEMYQLRVVICRNCFFSLPKLNKETPCTCDSIFECEIWKFCIEYLQKIFVPITADFKISLPGYHLTGSDYIRYVN